MLYAIKQIITKYSWILKKYLNYHLNHKIYNEYYFTKESACCKF